ncbi:EF-hand domain-containing protein [Paludisphaera mucosa]|uniref:EF-hand domain-containing protein n=1 Tax=Paludisphaera mucosa TaxID=3030827 RepID=A0ABT6FB50_9BACT|nr:EF-hand domain-containing protein [Paludisphaera mucosa]MDG3004784.1 EF-hand domain-containing protein [Paludisphaera mucosa]
MIRFLIVAAAALAQGPPGGGPSLSKEADVQDVVARMTAFDKDGDGKLARGEVSDARLLGLFDRADADKDGAVTKAELTALAEAEHSDAPDFDFGPPPGGGPGFDGFPGAPPSRPGEVLSPPLRQALELTPEQRGKIDELQAKVDAALAEILTDAQKAELKAAARPGPGPGGPPPGRGPGRRRPGPR